MDKTVFRPCPWCGYKPDVAKHFKSDEHQLIHRCAVMGNITLDWSQKSDLLERWNYRYIEEIRKCDTLDKDKGRVFQMITSLHAKV